MYKIYKIYNDKNCKLYIGQTKQTLKTRFQAHINAAKRDNEKTKIYNAMNKYGINNFHIELIEDNLTKEEVDDRERYWIEYYDSYYNGYNSTLGGQNHSDKKGHNYNYEEIAQYYLNEGQKSALKTMAYFHCCNHTVRHALDSCKVLSRIEYNRKIIIDYYLEHPNTSLAYMSQVLDINEQTISRVLENYNLREKTVPNSIYIKEHSNEVINHYKISNSIKQTAKFYSVHTQLISEILKENGIDIVYQHNKYDLKEIANLYKKYQNKKDVKEISGCYDSLIDKACQLYNIPVNGQATAKNARRGKVVQYSLQGKYIKEYNSSAEAVRELFGIDSKNKTSNINSCIRGEQAYAFNYLWKRYKPNEEILRKIDGIMK